MAEHLLPNSWRIREPRRNVRRPVPAHYAQDGARDQNPCTTVLATRGLKRTPSLKRELRVGGQVRDEISDDDHHGEVGTVDALIDDDSGIDLYEAVFNAMVDRWRAQMLARRLAVDTIKGRCRVVSRFDEFTNEYPWRWRPLDVDLFLADLRSQQTPIALSTLRSYMNAISMFCSYVSDSRYGWIVFCETQFGDVPSQICVEWNTLQHTTDDAISPKRRAFTKAELQHMFDVVDGFIDEQHRNGSAGQSDGPDAAGTTNRWPPGPTDRSVDTSATRRPNERPGSAPVAPRTLNAGSPRRGVGTYPDRVAWNSQRRHALSGRSRSRSRSRSGLPGGRTTRVRE
jgi:Phage integrase, N-terminal SAM-like domain